MPLSNLNSAKATPYILTIVRILVGFNLIRHGTIYLSGYPSGNPVPLISFLGVAGLLQLVGGLLVVLGLYMGPAGIVLAAEMFLLYFINNLPRSFWTVQNHGDATVFQGFFLLYLSAAGSGIRWDLNSPKTRYFHGILRIVVGCMFLQWGLQKSFGLFNGRMNHDFATMTGWAGVIETVGAPLIILGLFSRPAAFLLSGEMAVAYFIRWAPRGFWPSLEGNGEFTVYYCFIFLFLCVAGSGAFSIGPLFRRSEARPAVPTLLNDF